MQTKVLFAAMAMGTMLGTAPIANAADIIIKQPIHIAPAFSWAGPYLGFEAGVVMNKFHETDGSDLFTNLLVKPKETPAAGLFAGYNIAIGSHAVLGLDGNIDYHSSENSSTNDPYVKYKESALAAARLRLGFAQGRVMPYLAGGLSAVHAGLSVISPGFSLRDAKKQKTYLGWNIGGGLDYALAHNMLLRLDYRFSQIKIKDIYAIAIDNTLLHADPAIETKSHQIRIGAAYKF
ncbi:MAG: outer membrane beta-barrel protein [Alphaproteobacteria bacterium]|nr:outer membrane beta-barrel protein [Alphaproteobacteria bacterium]